MANSHIFSKRFILLGLLTTLIVSGGYIAGLIESGYFSSTSKPSLANAADKQKHWIDSTTSRKTKRWFDPTDEEQALIKERRKRFKQDQKKTKDYWNEILSKNKRVVRKEIPRKKTPKRPRKIETHTLSLTSKSNTPVVGKDDWKLPYDMRKSLLPMTYSELKARRKKFNVSNLRKEPDNIVLEWLYDTTVNDYLRADKSNRKWDKLAMEALWMTYQRLAEGYINTKQKIDIHDLYHRYKALVEDNNCTNPVVLYCYLRLRIKLKMFSNYEKLSEDGTEILNSIKRSGCTVFTKLAVNNLVTFLLIKMSNSRFNRRARYYMPLLMTEGEKLYKKLVQNPFMPDSILASTMIYQTWLVVSTTSKFGKGDFQGPPDSDPYPLLTVKECRPWASGVMMLEADKLITKAWLHRGTGFAKSVSRQGFATFYKYLREARTLLLKAHKQVPGFYFPCLKMITVCMGLGRPASEMNSWFKKAINADPLCMQAYAAKYTFLLPQWHGSTQKCLFFAKEMLKLARENVALTDLAQIIQSAHLLLAKRKGKMSKDLFYEYWKSPQVWKDVSLSYNLLSYKAQLHQKELDARFLAQTILCTEHNYTDIELFYAAGNLDQRIILRYRVNLGEEIEKIRQKSKE